MAKQTRIKPINKQQICSQLIKYEYFSDDSTKISKKETIQLSNRRIFGDPVNIQKDTKYEIKSLLIHISSQNLKLAN